MDFFPVNDPQKVFLASLAITVCAATLFYLALSLAVWIAVNRITKKYFGESIKNMKGKVK